jgi:hypothetical protein
MERKLHPAVNFPIHDIFIGEWIETYVEESALAEVRNNIAKLRPLPFDMSSQPYWSLGQALGNCRNAGKAFKMKK